jgi:hypothetical protein
MLLVTGFRPRMRLKVSAQRDYYSGMQNWYKNNGDYLSANPSAMAEAAANPEAYYKTHAGFKGGLIPAGQVSPTIMAPEAPKPGLVPAAGTPTQGYEPTGVKPPLDLMTGATATDMLATPRSPTPEGMYKTSALNDEERLLTEAEMIRRATLCRVSCNQYGKPLRSGHVSRYFRHAGEMVESAGRRSDRLKSTARILPLLM